MRERPRIGLTVGDPSGIGPEIVIKACESPRVRAVCEPIIYGPTSREMLRSYRSGKSSAAAGLVAYDAVTGAVGDACEDRLDAIATAPISKEAFSMAGLPWLGHTDLLAKLTSAPKVAMMFHSDVLKVVLATAHLPLIEAVRSLNVDLLTTTITLAAAELPRFGYSRPRLALAGLNPHAGENGLIGIEDQRILVPAVAASRSRGINIVGPIPADTVFVRAVRGEFDAVVVCYHDQGLIPVKLLAFGKSVNVTLGLPIIRTSVDHGTAFDIAGQGIADPSSMIEAVLLAAHLSKLPKSPITSTQIDPNRTMA